MAAALSLPGGKKSDEFLGVDLNDDTLKLVHVRNTRMKREVLNLLTLPVHGMADDDVANAIQETVQAWKLKMPHVYLSVPLYTVITRTIEIPSRDPQEIQEIVNLQASRHTPYSRSEIIIDTLTIGVVRENYTRVLLVIAPRDVIQRQTKILEKAGLALERICFSPEAIAIACAKIVQNQAADSSLAIVHMDQFFTSFIVAQGSRILFVRGIPVGADHLLEEKEVYADRFVDELQKSIDAYMGDETGPRPSLLLLTGVAAETHNLDDLFKETLQIPIKHQTYFNYFSITENARTVAASSQHVSFFNMIASLLLFDKIKVDLVSEERKLKRDLHTRGREMMKTGILCLALLLTVFFVFMQKLYFKTEYLNQIKSRYAPIRNEAKGLEQLFAKTQIVKDYLVRRGTSIDSLSELYEALPLDVRLSGVKYEGGEKFSVKGTSRTMASVFLFVSNLERSPRFKSVKTKYVTTREENGEDVADFEITTTIEGRAS